MPYHKLHRWYVKIVIAKFLAIHIKGYWKIKLSDQWSFSFWIRDKENVRTNVFQCLCGAEAWQQLVQELGKCQELERASQFADDNNEGRSLEEMLGWQGGLFRRETRTCSKWNVASMIAEWEEHMEGERLNCVVWEAVIPGEDGGISLRRSHTTSYNRR